MLDFYILLILIISKGINYVSVNNFNTIYCSLYCFIDCFEWNYMTVLCIIISILIRNVNITFIPILISFIIIILKIESFDLLE